jgi:hypothetical protein
MHRSLIAAALIAFCAVFSALPAHAQATRTWVSGVGDDANPCSRTAPCKTFAGAISKTAAGGEINCLDPAGYGGVTITKAMTLNCAYTLGSILVAGVPGITINAGVNDRVTVRGLDITGINQTAVPGTIGIRILAAQSVSIEDSVITSFGQQGIIDTRSSGQTRLFIKNTMIRNNTGAGIVAAGTNTNVAVLENVQALNNLYGLAIGASNNVVADRSVFSGNTNAGAEVDPGGKLDLLSSIVSHNNVGVQGFGAAVISDNTITFNNVAFEGTVTTFGNNRFVGNGGLGGTLVPAGATSAELGQQ